MIIARCKLKEGQAFINHRTSARVNYPDAIATIINTEKYDYATEETVFHVGIFATVQDFIEQREPLHVIRLSPNKEEFRQFFSAQALSPEGKNPVSNAFEYLLLQQVPSDRYPDVFSFDGTQWAEVEFVEV